MICRGGDGGSEKDGGAEWKPKHLLPYLLALTHTSRCPERSLFSQGHHSVLEEQADVKGDDFMQSWSPYYFCPHAHGWPPGPWWVLGVTLTEWQKQPALQENTMAERLLVGWTPHEHKNWFCVVEMTCSGLGWGRGRDGQQSIGPWGCLWQRLLSVVWLGYGRWMKMISNFVNPSCARYGQEGKRSRGVLGGSHGG